MDEFTLRILTLNVWGIAYPYPIGSKDRLVRLAAIAKKLARSTYDIVALQEVWSESDFEMIANTAKNALPFAHYFHSGFLGSGVCVLSRHRIVDSMMHRYSLNGFAHHIHRGDWFGGKVVGMVQIEHPSGPVINFYTTHLHAEYNRQNDLYHPHRVVQSWELGQFMKHTGHSADISVLGGDLNLEPNDLGMRIIRDVALLRDSWAVRPNAQEGDEGNTCDVPSNIYSLHSDHPEMVRAPNGKRIDYLLFTHKQNVLMDVDSCVVLHDKVDGEGDMPLSDHQAVSAGYLIKVKESENMMKVPMEKTHSMVDSSKTLYELAIEQMDIGSNRVYWDRIVFLATCFLLTVSSFYTIDAEISYPSAAIIMIPLRFLMTLAIAFCFWHGVVLLTIEEKGLKAAKQSLLAYVNARL